MNPPSRLILYFGILLAVIGPTISMAAQKPTPDMILILAHHKTGDHDLGPMGLMDDKSMHYPTKKEEVEFEIYSVPYPKGVADYFQYGVLFHTKTGRYWIWISGGFAGVNRFLGPGKVSNLKK